MITVKNFLSKKECKELIKWHNECWPQLDGNLTEVHYNQFVINISQIESNLFKYIQAKLNYEIQKINNKAYTNYYQLTKWNTGCSAVPHKDIATHLYSSICYLNDNYTGGHTIVGDDDVKPETGKLIIFEGAKILHSVTKITKGIRFTLPCWYNLYK